MLNVASEEQTGEEQKFLGDFSKFKSGVKTSEGVECSGTSINKQRTWKYGSSEGICSQRQKEHYLWSS